MKSILNTRPYDKIHQISFLRDGEKFNIACSAGREILVTRIVDDEFSGGFITKFNDWISSIKYLDDGSIVAITSHNFAVNLELKDQKLEVKKKFKCEDNSTLYCSFIHGNTFEELIFFAGKY